MPKRTPQILPPMRPAAHLYRERTIAKKLGATPEQLAVVLDSPMGASLLDAEFLVDHMDRYSEVELVRVLIEAREDIAPALVAIDLTVEIREA